MYGVWQGCYLSLTKSFVFVIIFLLHDIVIFVFNMHCQMHTIAITILSVCLSVCLSHWWSVPEWLDISKYLYNVHHMIEWCFYTVSQKKFPPLNCMQLCEILTNFQNFCTAGKRMKFVTKLAWNCPSHLRQVATLPWEIKNSNFLQIFSRYRRKCQQIVFYHF